MRVRSLVALGVTALAAWSELAVSSRDDAIVWLPDLVTGLAWLALGLLTWDRSRATAALAVAVSASWFAAGLVPGANLWHRGVVFHLLLACPGWWPRRVMGRVSLAAGYVAVLVPGLWGYEAFNVVAAVAFALAVTAERWAKRGPALRVSLTCTAVAAGLSSVLVAGAVARSVVPNDDAVVPALVGYEVALVAAAWAIAWALSAHTMPRVTDTVLEVGAAPDVTLRAALARALDVREYEEGIAAAARLSAAHEELRAELAARIADVELSRRRLVVAADEERARLVLRLERGAERRLRRISTLIEPLPPEGHLAAARHHLARAIRELHDLARGLSPHQLSDGLGPALRAIAASSPAPVQVMADGRRFPAELEAGAFFACSEALANALKHGEASMVMITVGGDEHSLVLEVSDDGIGGADPDGPGLTGLRDRVEALGGQLTVDSAAGQGTSIRAVIEVP